MKNIIYDHQHSATSPTRIQIPASAHPRPLSLTPGFSQVHPHPLHLNGFNRFLSTSCRFAHCPPFPQIQNPKSKIANPSKMPFFKAFQTFSNFSI
jgi:hypothetical protein